jgi:endonuclease-3
MKIDKIIEIMKKEVKKFDRPFSSDIGKVTKDPFKVLISCILSLRAKDQMTEKTSKALFEVADTPEKILALSNEEVEKLIYQSGFYKNKAKTIKHISKKIIEEHDSKVPDSMEELLKFNGVGRKTAGITMLYGFGKVVSIPVDTHVHRISNRLGIVETKIPEKTEDELMKILPKKYWYDYNILLVAWGQNVCKPISPKCSICKIKKYCKRIGVKKFS